MSPGGAGRFPVTAADDGLQRLPCSAAWVEIAVGGGFPGRCSGRCLGAACLRPHSVPRVIPADVPEKAEIEAVGAFGRRSLVSACLDPLRPYPSAFWGSAASLRTG